MKKYVAEFIGTFVLVFLGTGSVVLAKGDTLTVGLAFGLAVTMMAYAVGGISGGHFNSAVTVAMMVNKRTEVKDGICYILSQFLGALVASLVVSFFVHALGLKATALGQTDFNHVTAGQAFLFEMITTFIFLFIIFMVTSQKFGHPTMAPVAIGLALGFLIIVSSTITGGSLNPARSFGPAIVARGTALSHYWVFFIAPVVGAVLAAFVSRFMGSEEKA